MKLLLSLWLPLFLVGAVVMGCRSRSESSKEKTYEIKGIVVALDAKKPSAKLDHQDIPGFMMAMEMEFDAASPKVLEGLRPGDKVQGKLKVEAGKAIITVLEKSP
jgi:Cu/Ag efflux protein CusF